MIDYDADVYNAKKVMTDLICRPPESPARPMEIANATDCLNKAWEELTDSLARQVVERNRVISNLCNELAEARKK